MSANIVDKMVINKKNIEKNLGLYGPFSALEAILLKSVKNGANRQEIHEVLRVHSMKVYDEMQETGKNNLFTNLKKDKKLLKYLTPAEIENLSDYKHHIGLAPKKASDFAQKIKQSL